VSPAHVGDGHRIVCTLDRMLEARGMTLTELADRVGVTIVNLSVLKNDRAKAVRFSTLSAICQVLECDVGDILRIAG
jgi:putative transcriptional regulator